MEKEIQLTEEEKKLILERRQKQEETKADIDWWEQYDRCYCEW